MVRRVFLYCALALSLFAVGPDWRCSEAADLGEGNRGVLASRQRIKARETVHATKPDPEQRIGGELPRMGMLAAFIRWGVTTFGVFDASSRELIRLAAKETGPLVFSLEANRLAYLVREGTNPAKNYIEILDWRSGGMLVVEPADDYALLGFALDPEAKKLVYAAMNIRTSRSTNVTWRVGLVDLERHETRVTLTSSSSRVDEQGIPVPFAWSRRTGRIYLQGWLPFRGLIKQSIWALSPEGGQPTKVIPGPGYTGIPRLSLDGSRLVYLAAELDTLPRDYIAPPGTPPGNVMSVMDLVSGDKDTWARGGEKAFGVYAWSASGEEVLAVEQAWLKGKFRDVEMRRVGKTSAITLDKIDQSRSAKEITGIIECRDRALFWVEKDAAAARLNATMDRSTKLLFDFPEGVIQPLGCLNR